MRITRDSIVRRLRPSNLAASLLHRTLLAAAVSLVMSSANLTVNGEGALAPSTMRRVGAVDERYQSYNVEMAEVIGGRFWKPYGTEPASAPTPPPATGGSGQAAGLDPSLFQQRPPVDLSAPRLRALAAALGPAYVRVSGSWANMVYFHDADTPAPAEAPQGFQGVLTRAQWKGVLDFARAVNAKLVTSFAISPGVRDESGRWTPVQARSLADFTRRSGGDIAAAELFNEPNIPAIGGAPKGYSAADFARDIAAFRAFAHDALPGMRIVGPGSVGEGSLMRADGAGAMPGFVKTDDMMTAEPAPRFDIFSYHFYGAVSQRCARMGPAMQTTADAALSEEWLARTDQSFAYYAGLRDRFAPGTPIWLTETADAACGGNPWATTFVDSFRYLDQLGRLAVKGVAAVFHNTLAASEYGLLDAATFEPRPHYWAALLWHRMMGATVLDASALAKPELHAYAHCLAGRPGGVAVLLLNLNRNTAQSITLPSAAERYTLSAESPTAPAVQLNGKTLALQGDELPAIAGESAPAGPLTLPPASITFLGFPGAANSGCR